MTIGRMQMNRQLYGVGSLVGREKFGLGSSLKKFARKIIPNEVSKIAVKAAPFVAPFNPLLAGAMAGIGGFDQTGRIGSSLKRGLLTYGGGQAARYLGGAGLQQGINPFQGVSFSDGIMSGLGQTFTSPMTGAPMFGQAPVTPVGNNVIDPGMTQKFTGNMTGDPTQFGLEQALNQGSQVAQQGAQQVAEKSFMEVMKSGNLNEIGNYATKMGGKALKSIYTSPITNAAGEIVDTKLDKSALLATIVMVPSYFDAKKLADDAGLNDDEFNEEIFNAEVNKNKSKYQANLKPENFGITTKANGGRIGYKDGTDKEGIQSLMQGPPEDMPTEGMSLFFNPDGTMIGAEEEEAGIKSLMMPEEKPKGFKNQYLYNKIIESKDSFEPETFDRLKRTYEEKIIRDKGGIPSITLDEKITEEDMPTEGMSLFFQPDGVTPIEQKANGGRMGFSKGTDRPPAIPADEFQKLLEEFMKNQDKQEELRKKKAMGGRIGYAVGGTGSRMVDGVSQEGIIPGFIKRRSEFYNADGTIDQEKIKAANYFKNADGTINQVTPPTEFYYERVGEGGGYGPKTYERIAANAQTTPTEDFSDYLDTSSVNTNAQTTPTGLTSVAETLFPQGDFLNIKETATSPTDYNIRATEDLVKNLPGGIVKDMVAPAAALVSSPFYDAIQAYQRMEPSSGIQGFGKAYQAERPLQSAFERFTGAAGPLANNINTAVGGLNSSQKQQYMNYAVQNPNKAIAAAQRNNDFMAATQRNTTPAAMANGGRIGFSDGSPGYWEQAQELFDQVGGEEATGLTLIDFANKYLSLDRNNKAMGGSMGSEVPIRRNQGGISELDYRNTGGFVPIGVKEKADDVPAMLSKNEFVFTADAVRNAGGGNVNKGAQKMYNTMKSLENKVV